MRESEDQITIAHPEHGTYRVLMWAEQNGWRRAWHAEVDHRPTNMDEWGDDVFPIGYSPGDWRARTRKRLAKKVMAFVAGEWDSRERHGARKETK